MLVEEIIPFQWLGNKRSMQIKKKIFNHTTFAIKKKQKVYRTITLWIEVDKYINYLIPLHKEAMKV